MESYRFLFVKHLTRTLSPRNIDWRLLGALDAQLSLFRVWQERSGLDNP
jgi:hypothetical protein